MWTRCAAWPLNGNAAALAAMLACLLASGCSDDSHRLGGATQAAAERGEPRVLGLCSSGADLELLDNMEDGDGAIDMIARRGGVWFSFNDETEGGWQLPASDDETFAMTELDPPRSGSRFAVHTWGEGFTDWGAGVGFELQNQKAYDLSKYAGITFWARRAPDTASALRFAISDAATAPRGGQCSEAVGYRTCSDHFGVDVSLGTAFRRYSFNWHELSQVGWGMPSPDSIDTSRAYGVKFQMDPYEAFDFWIDDIALLCHPD